MSCDKCHNDNCCCETRIPLRGPQGERGEKAFGTPGADGTDGAEAYIYIAYAANVVAGNPDVVTGFSLTTKDCWVAIISSIVPLVPVQSDFQGKWVYTCGGDPCVCCTGFHATIAGNPSSGATMTATPFGGAGPYTYEWSLAQNNYFIGGQPPQGVTAPSSQVTGVTGQGTTYLWKCKVTDSKGCIYITYYRNVTPPA